MEGDVAKVKEVLLKNPNQGSRHRFDRIPLHAAAGDANANLEICKLLLDKGADPNAKTNLDKTVSLF